MNVLTFTGKTIIGALLVFMLLASAKVSAQCPANVNLIVNGDAEAQQSLTGNVDHDVDGWVDETGAFTVVRYDQGGAFPTASSPGPSTRGNYFFTGSPSANFATASQTVNISACAAAVDTGQLEFSLSGYFGGIGADNDRARLDVQFYNGSNIQIGLTTIGPVTNDDRGNTTGLLSRGISGFIPIATRSIQFVIFITPQVGNNEGLADNLSFVIVVPTAAEVTVGGRVTEKNGRAISRATVSIADVNGTSRTAVTNPFGFFNFAAVEVGQTYVLSVTHKRFTFSPQVLNLTDSVSDLSFIPN